MFFLLFRVFLRPLPRQGEEDVADEQEPAEQRRDQEAPGHEDGDKFPDQRGGPVIQRDSGADAGAAESDLARQPQAAVDMVVIPSAPSLPSVCGALSTI